MGSLLALSGALPALVVMGLIERFDAKRPEPKQALRRVALWGGLSTLPAIVIEQVLAAVGPTEGAPQALWSAFVVAALTEESMKALVLYWAVWRAPVFDERLDGIVYATRAGLGFALVENVGYLLGTQGSGAFLWVFMLRAALAVPGHAVYAGFMGYWAARRRFDRVGPGLFGGLLIAVALHGTYDGALFLVDVVVKAGQPVLVLPLVVVPFAVVLGGYRRLRRHAGEALRLDDLAEARAAAVTRLRLPFGMGFTLR
jgi:RsiW-degrading membrane proteinase PrsW (M82 family)